MSNKNGRIVLVGNPNVGKSLIFNRLTGLYANVSNYPGTTVEVYEGTTIINNKAFEVIDTPGMYSLLPITEEEKVARNYLLSEETDIVIHVIDAKNIRRMLSLTLQLIETDLPLILVINMIDEAEGISMDIDIKKLEERLGIPIIKTSAAHNRGIVELKERIDYYVRSIA